MVHMHPPHESLFEFGHLPLFLQAVSQSFYDMSRKLYAEYERLTGLSGLSADDIVLVEAAKDQVSASLWKLLEAKDPAVRSIVLSRRVNTTSPDLPKKTP